MNERIYLKDGNGETKAGQRVHGVYNIVLQCKSFYGEDDGNVRVKSEET